MALNKKIVMLPYDFDTAIGIDNYGRLKFSYELEDIDTVNDEKVYAGQDSVLWKNVRAAFDTELTAMYKNLRSGNNPVLSYDNVKAMFENHQNKWSEALFNEDSWYKYILPLIENNENRLEMCLGSKAEQRKWWLYNRFKYIDSKYNAGDAAADSVSLRTYYEPAQGETYGITITPYADIYATVMYGVAKGQLRAPRNQAILVPCSLSHLEFTDTYIYSASQVKSFGDLSIFKPDAVEFSKATHIQELKLGDSSSNYENPNLKALSLGNNVLLKKVDCRNCINMGTGAQKTVDLSGCSNIEEVYFDGTAIQGLTLPNGGFLKKLHLPGTITNLTLLNQKNITEFVCPDFSNISTLRLENIPNNIINTKSIINDITTGSRIRLIGFYWTAEDAEEISDLLDILDTMRGLDEQDNTIAIEDGGCSTTISGEIHTSSLSGAEIASFNQRYPYLRVTADHISCVLRYYNYDGSTLLNEETVLDGGNGTWATQPTRPATPANTFTFIGWSLNMNQSTADANATKNVNMDRNVYAAYTATGRTYTVWFYNGTTLLQTVNNVPYGGTATYTGTTPIHSSGDTETYPFDGWTPSNENIQGNTNCIAKFKDLSSITRKLIKKEAREVQISGSIIGSYAFYANRLSSINASNVTIINTAAFADAGLMGATINMPELVRIEGRAFNNCNLSYLNASKLSYIGGAAFSQAQYLQEIDYPLVTEIGQACFERCFKLQTVNLPTLQILSSYAFKSCSQLTSINIPQVTSIPDGCFDMCSNLVNINCSNITYIGRSAFQSCKSLVNINIPNVTTIVSSAFAFCKVLTTISLPVLISIQGRAFANCSQLMSIYLLGSNRAFLNDSEAFLNTPMSNSTYTGSFGSIYVPASLVSNYKTANNWSYYASRITSYIE